MGTENIKPSLFLRYPFQIAGPTIVEIPNRYQPKDKPHPLIEEWGLISSHMLSLGYGLKQLFKIIYSFA